MTERDFEQTLRVAFRQMVEDAAPADLRASVIAIPEVVPAFPDRRFAPRWEIPPTIRFATVALAATAVVVALLIGIGILVRPPNVGPPIVPSPTPEATAQPSAPRAATWTTTGSMASPIGGNTAARLLDGTVLVFVNGDSASAELYDPASGTWRATGQMVQGGQTATALPNGQVLVTGDSASSAQLYDPVSGTWTATGQMNEGGRSTATLLARGLVLVTGGSTISSELYDPDSGSWTSTGNMVEVRDNHTATLLSDGRVLVVGGLSGPKISVASAEVYDPASGSWAATGSLATGRYWHTATLLADGKVLIAGGAVQTGGGEPILASAELYDLVTGTWSITGTMGDARFAHTATRLADGRVLVVGGTGVGAALTSAELYDSASGSWTPTASMTAGRVSHFAILLPSGEVLVGGGGDIDSVPLPTAELYDPGSGS